MRRSLPGHLLGFFAGAAIGILTNACGVQAPALIGLMTLAAGACPRGTGHRHFSRTRQSSVGLVGSYNRNRLCLDMDTFPKAVVQAYNFLGFLRIGGFPIDETDTKPDESHCKFPAQAIGTNIVREPYHRILCQFTRNESGIRQPVHEDDRFSAGSLLSRDASLSSEGGARDIPQWQRP